ncbi:PREDICTED: uncharacterized protein LOC105965897 [Erythranthe guttata]|uniref:uncharacterized protein LOC105965897 n=1 Tax=Erythranthe guttata TaxID=4155 RepID=UPI00064DF8F7|nr:PREDICTED: uncharacterized protein LOC105965897 [Erythranthe guttata]|eukprot:XP_012845897.1 PREDICTED: uncharacterized protein LOC105965897 [Erythranthe guttata]
MAQTTTNLIDLKPCRFDWKVVVRVMRLWKVPSKNNPNEMISIDMGDKIHASIKCNPLKKFELIVNEGRNSISNAFHSSKLLINENLEEHREYRENRNKLRCALSDKYAEELSTHLINDISDSPIIIILQLCMVKSFNGRNSISNVFHSSKLLINENLEEHREYREKLMMQAGTFSQSISQLSTQRFIGISDDLLQTEHMTISDLMDYTSI